MFKYIHVAVPIPHDKTFTYAVPERFKDKISAGKRVLIPFGKRKKVIGFVLELATAGNNPAIETAIEIKDILDILDDEPVFSAKTLSWLVRGARYYLAPIGEALKTALPAPLTNPNFKRPQSRGDEDFTSEDFSAEGIPVFTPAQEDAFERICSPLKEKKFASFLLHGVTGSGKTEVYLRVIEEALRAGRQAIVLIPEIGLTPQTLGRFRGRFGKRIATYHSQIKTSQRLNEWERMKSGELPIVVGTRSALFAPCPNLGVIIVDEEHDNSYKQDDRFRYNARDMAILRASIEGAVVVLGSATPSLESIARTKTGKGIYLRLPERVLDAIHPEMKVVDMRKAKIADGQGGILILSGELKDEIKKNLDRKLQSLIFLNRRGFATSLICSDCGHGFLCPNCEITLTYHKQSKKLLCHYCDYAVPAPNVCPKCDGVRVRQIGIGTERIEEEIKRLFPDARIARMDHDTMGKRGSWKKLLEKLKKGEIDILIGTQMVAKGHDYPGITLVGIISADLGIQIPDFRSAERNFQIITQVAGRAGRGNEKGLVIIQSFNPDHYSISFARDQDFTGFYDKEMSHRKEVYYPPYSKLIQLTFSGNKKEAVISSSKKAACELQKKIFAGRVDILGPAPCPLERLRGKYRWRILVKSPPDEKIKAILGERLDELREKDIPSGVKMTVDVDPVNMM